MTTTSFAAGSGSSSLAGNFGVSTFTPGTGTVVFDGTSALSNPYTFYGLTIASGSSLDTAGNTVTINGTFVNLGTLYRRGGDTVTQTDAAEGTVVYRTTTGNIQSYGGSGDYYNLIIGDGISTVTMTLGGTIQVNNDLTISTISTLVAGSYALNVAEKWMVNGSGAFTAGTGTVNFINAAKTTIISGTNNFNVLSSTAAGKTIEFTSGTTQTVATFTIAGTVSNPIVLSGTTTSAWTIIATSSNVSYATVSWSTASTYVITSYTSTDGGNNNANWHFSTTFTWNGASATWNSASNWLPATAYPGQAANQSAVIASVGTPPTLSVNPANPLNNLTINSGATLTINGATSLTVTNLTIQAGGTLILSAVSGVTINVTNLTIGTYGSSTGTLTLNGNTLNITGTFVNYGILQRYTQTATANMVTKMDVAEGTVLYNLAGAGAYVQDYGSQDYYNLNISTPVTLNYDLGVKGTLTLGSTLTSTTQTISVGGNWAGGINEFTAGTGTVIFNDATQTTVVTGTTSFYGLSILTPGKTVNFGATTTTVLTGGTLSVTGASGNYVNLTGTGWTITLAGTATSAVNFAAVDHGNVTTGQVITAYGSVDNGNNNTNGNTNGWTFAADYTWNGSGANTNWSNTANWTTSYTGTYPNNAARTVSIPTGSLNNPGLDVSVSISSVTIGSGKTLTTSQTLTTTTLTVGGTLTLGAALTATNLTIQSSAKMNIEGQNVTVGGTFVNNGMLYRSGLSSMNVTDTAEGTVIYDTAGGTIQDYGTGNDYYNLTLGDGSTSLGYTTGSALSIAGALTVTAASSLSMGSNALSTAGTTTVNGTLGTLGSGSGAMTLTGGVTGTGTFIASSTTTTVGSMFSSAAGNFSNNAGTLVLTGSPTLSSTYIINNLTLNSSGTVTLTASQTVNGNLVMTAGTLALGSYTISVAGNLTTISGVLTGSAGTGIISFINPAITSVVTGATTFPNLTIGTSGSPMGGKTVQFQASAIQTVSGTLNLYGASGNMVKLRSTSTGTQWTLAPSSSTSANFVDVEDSKITVLFIITANSSLNSLNNTLATTGGTTPPGWYFPVPTSYTWSSTAASSAWTSGGNWVGGIAPRVGRRIYRDDPLLRRQLAGRFDKRNHALRPCQLEYRHGRPPDLRLRLPGPGSDRNPNQRRYHIHRNGFLDK